MLVKPDLQDEKIAACLAAKYGLAVASITFLPLGADQDSIVYRVVAHDDSAYFLKLRRGNFDETAVELPRYLSTLGIRQIIPPLAAKSGRFWANLDSYKVILYPFVNGRNGYELALSDQHWREFGATLRRIHAAGAPPALRRTLRQETFTAHWRELVMTFMARVVKEHYAESIAQRTAALLQTNRAEILALVARTEQLVQVLQAQDLDFIVCHADLHAGNFLLAEDGAFYIVDWDTSILAPKERDLMYVGAGLAGGGRTPEAEERLFYQGYGSTDLDLAALTYYRYERIIEDIALFCEQLLLTDEGGEDRAQALSYLASNFLPNGAIALARRSDKGALSKCLH